MPSNELERGRQPGPRKYAYNLEAAREREMHLYLPYWGFSHTEKFAQQSFGQSPDVSRDNVLTVFAQLASLRLKTFRSFISLFDRTTQHVVAEATPHVGLRGTGNTKRSDSLWLGVQQLPRDSITMCNEAVTRFTQENKDIFVVPDLTQDERFQSHSSVTGPPYHRFYASVPVRSPEAYVIGSVAVMDDKPRDGGLSEEEIQVLHELSATIMDHLLSQRAMREEYREEKMVRALGLFVQGKSDLNEGIYSRDWANDKASEQLLNVNDRLGQLQMSSGASGSKSGSPQAKKDDLTSPGNQDSSEKGSRSPVRKFKTSGNDAADTEEEKEENQLRPSMSPTTSQIQNSIAPSSVQFVLNRASCLMEQALDVEGVMFVDSSVYARRRMIGSNNGSHHNEFTIGPDSDDSYDEDDYFNTRQFEDPNEPKTLVLGYSTSSASSRDDDQRDSHYVPLPGTFISSLIDRYPRGKIFHIDADGSIALSYEGLADDISQAYIAGDRRIEAASPKEKNLQLETRDIKQFRKALPDARCIAIYPVWDFHRSRWFTLSVAWTNDPGRVLSEPKDLTYLAAFSNNVMAEVSRIDLEAADRAKGDFISSISHELRSPLHGVLGTVELLQETAMSYSQRGLIETVYSCGRTLLDTLNHLLDYAKINTLTASRPAPDGGDKGDSNKPKLAVPGMVQDEDVSGLVQEVVEGLLAGAEFYNRESDNAPELSNRGSDKWSTSSRSNPNRWRMMNIVDIEWQQDWHYSVYAGAWRRVVMNLFGNALKYTKSGYIRLLMKKDFISKGENEKIPAVRIIISDSGRGMAQDFLLHHLYIPFLQEDTQSPGLGVGLHLVHQIVKSLDGQIHFRSELERGTDVDVLLPVSEPEKSPQLSLPYESLRERLSGMTVSSFTQSLERGDMGIRPEAFEDMLQSLSRMVTDWFGLRVLTQEECQQQHADFLIVTEHEYRTIAHQPEESDIRSSIESSTQYPLIVLSAQASSWKVVKESKEDQAVFLSQPVSPKTLAAIFEHCLDQSRSSRSSPWESRRSSAEKNQEITGQDHKPQEDFPQEFEQNNPRGERAKRVLLVEDNPINLKIIETCVRNEGYQYQTAMNGLEAVESFKLDRFDVVVMDISMPIMDGLEATRKMRQFERTKGMSATPIIILTAVLSADMQQEAIRSGVNQFLTKPTPLKELKQLLQNLPQLEPPSHA